MGEARAIGDLIVGSVGYRTTVGPLDKGKVTAESQGKRRPMPAAKLAQAAVRAYRLDGPAPPVVNVSLDPIWRQDGVFVRNLSNFDGAKRAAARAIGCSWLAIQLDNAPWVPANENELRLIGAHLRAQGWLICGWATYGQDTDPHTDGIRQAGIRSRLGLEGWLPNGEAWAEKVDRWKTGAWLDGWKQAGGAGPVLWSILSSTTGNYPRDWDYKTALSYPGSGVAPQVYSASNPDYTVDAMVASLAKVPVPVGATAPTFQVKDDLPLPLADLKTWKGPRSFWVGEDWAADKWKVLAG